MFNLFINLTKLTVIMIWIAFILGLVSFFPDSYNFIFVILGILLIVIHLVEYIVVTKMLNKNINFFQTMLYGYGHWLPLIKSK